MICVTLGRGRHSALLQEWKAAAEAGAPLVELRLDCLRRDPDLKRLLAERHTPVVITIRRGSDGGLWRGDEAKRQRILREAIALGVDFVDLETDIAKQIPRFGKTKRIISYHNFKATPAELPEIVAGMKGLQADFVKFATLAHSLADACRVLEQVADAGAPAIGIAMGEVGFFTRVLGPIYGAAMTYAGFNPDRVFAPGMPQFLDLRDDYEYDLINPQTEVYAVIGDPIAHSLSPAVHNRAFRHLGLNKVYVPIRVPAGQLKEAFEAFATLKVQGLSVTIPHKEAVVPLLDQSDGAVANTGACNTVVFQAGRKFGYNTDYHAAMNCLEDALGGRKTPDVSPLLDKQVLILGAGGVARAIAFGLVRRGAGVMICNRTEERAAKLAEDAGCRSVSWAMRASTIADVLINCTPIGMHPKVDETPLPPATFRPGQLVFDTIYHPENTMLLKLARERDCQTVTGVDMFVRQAAHQFQLFTGQTPPIDAMREVVKRKLGAVRS